MTPPQTLLYQKRDGNGWQVRAFANKFAALSPGGRTTRDVKEGFFTETRGVGVHEVIVETPLHNRSLALMGEDEILKVLNAYHERYNKLSQQPFETWILPKKQQASFGGVSDEDLGNLAHILRVNLIKL